MNDKELSAEQIAVIRARAMKATIPGSGGMEHRIFIEENQLFEHYARSDILALLAEIDRLEKLRCLDRAEINVQRKRFQAQNAALEIRLRAENKRLDDEVDSLKAENAALVKACEWAEQSLSPFREGVVGVTIRHLEGAIAATKGADE